MAKLSAWLKKRLGSPEKQSADRPPYLSSPRRPLTPTSFDPPSSNGVTIQRQPSQCLFFAKLPDDVRRKILITAFGARTLHIDLVFDIPRSPPQSKPGSRQQPVWQWRSAICHRHGSAVPSNGWERFWMSGQWVDNCLESMYRQGVPYDRKGHWSEEYMIGIMGFLLSCRQAYTEGIDVLFSTNCIALQSEPLLFHLPRLVVLERLSSISSIELYLKAHQVQRDEGRTSFRLDHLKPILDNVAKNCRNLHRFDISFTGFYSTRDHIIGGPALPLLDGFYRSMQLRFMRVEVPYNTARAFKGRSTETHPLEGPPVQRMYDKALWRALDGEEPELQYRKTENYPGPPYKLPVSENGDESVLSSGYWISQGEEWSPIYMHNCGNRI